MLKRTLICTTIAVSGLCGEAMADMVVFENRGELGPLMLFDPNFGDVIYGQSLNITRGAMDQPAISETPEGSIFFMHILDRVGDFIWMGTGRLTDTARSLDPTAIFDPDVLQDVDYFGPESFGAGDIVNNDANFIEGWRPIHAINRFIDTPGIFTVDEVFTVGIRFDMQGQTHFGFAQLERTYEVRNDTVRVDITPVRWGYESIAGVGARVVPAPGAAGLLLIGGFASAIKRRR